MENLFETSEFEHIQYLKYDIVPSFFRGLILKRLKKNNNKFKNAHDINIVLYHNLNSNTFEVRGIVKNDDAFYLVDESGNIVSDGYEKIVPFNSQEEIDRRITADQVAKKVDFRDRDFIDKTIHMKISTDFLVFKNDKIGVISKDGKILIKCNYKEIRPFTFKEKLLFSDYYAGTVDLYLAYYEVDTNYWIDVDISGEDVYLTETLCDVYSPNDGKLIFNRIVNISPYTIIEKFNLGGKGESSEKNKCRIVDKIYLHYIELVDYVEYCSEYPGYHALIIDSDMLYEFDEYAHIAYLKNSIEKTDSYDSVNVHTFEEYMQQTAFQQYILEKFNIAKEEFTEAEFKAYAFHNVSSDALIDELNLPTNIHNFIMRYVGRKTTISDLKKINVYDWVGIQWGICPRFRKSNAEYLTKCLKAFIVTDAEK